MNKDTSSEKGHAKMIRGTIEKIVVNAGVGRANQLATFEDKVLPQILRDLAKFTGQKAEARLSKKSIAGFKMRQGQTVGLRITLRSRKMVDFFDRLIRIVLPRVHDFRGIAETAVDMRGALNIGLREQMVFPEINPEESAHTFSLGINIVPKVSGRAKALEFYKQAGVPFKK